MRKIRLQLYTKIKYYTTSFNPYKIMSKSFNSNEVSNLPQKMRAVLQIGSGGINTLFIGNANLPKLKPDEILIKVEAFCINRADILQREGKYPPPKGVSDILGLECSGYVVEDGVVNKNKKVIALVGGGAYAEYVAVKKNHIITIPKEIDIIDAASIPEAWLTAYQLCKIANVKKDDFVLVHAAASGVGTALIQLIRLYEAESICMVSNEKKLTFCAHLGQGTAQGILRKDSSKISTAFSMTKNRGCSVIMDCVGAQEFDFNLSSAAMDCRWISYGFLGGSFIGDFNLAKLFAKRINLHFTSLRNRSDDYKTKLMEDFTHEIMPKFINGELAPVIDTIYANVEDIKEAHQKMEMDLNIGKIVVKWNN